MSFDVSTGAVVAVLNEVNPKLQSYQGLLTAFGDQLQALNSACMAEPIGAALQGASEKAFSPAMTNVAGRTGNAVTAVNDVLRILTAADQTMSQTAREAAARTAQAGADDRPHAPGTSAGQHGPGRGRINYS